MSPLATADASLQDPETVCEWCRLRRRATSVRWCGKKCRQAAWRSRKLSPEALGDDQVKRLAYADPPYPGLAWKFYRGEPSYAGEVDHAALIRRLLTYDGWALSTSQAALRDVLSFVPASATVEVCPWVKPHGKPKARGPANIHEYVIVAPARRRLSGPRDALVAAVARGGGELPGRKPIAFVNWLFELLGADQHDILDDLFPGTGVVLSCWRQFQRASLEDLPLQANDT